MPYRQWIQGWWVMERAVYWSASMLGYAVRSVALLAFGLLAAVGPALVLVGVGLIYIPAAVILGGVFVSLATYQVFRPKKGAR